MTTPVREPCPRDLALRYRSGSRPHKALLPPIARETGCCPAGLLGGPISRTVGAIRAPPGHPGHPSRTRGVR